MPGEGPADARLMFIGEGPGYHENQQGRPFVGVAGQLLDELLLLAGLTRHEVFIGNVVKCRPPQNRDPKTDEVKTCTSHYLFRQIDAINPSVLVTLGRFSMELFLPGEKISRIHGQLRQVGGRMVVPMLHPAAALHQPKNRALIEEDFRRLPAMLDQAAQQTAPDTPDDQEPPPQQLSMF